MVHLLKFYWFSKSRHFSKKSFACGPNFRIAKNFAQAFGARLYVSIASRFKYLCQYNQKLQKSCLVAKIGATLHAPFVNVSRVGFDSMEIGFTQKIFSAFVSEYHNYNLYDSFWARPTVHKYLKPTIKVIWSAKNKILIKNDVK